MSMESANRDEEYLSILADGINKIRMTVRMVTPKTAQEWLGHNVNNRPMNRETVARYVQYMTKGEWRLNGETIVLDEEENLLDGQHRLTAVVQSGVSVPMCVVTGISQDAFKTLNQGKIRSWADTLAVKGEVSAASLASALHWMHRYVTDTILSRKTVRLSNMEMLQLLDEFPGMRNSVRWVSSRAQAGVHPPSPFAFLHYVCMEKHPEREDFFERVLTGTRLEPDSPEDRLYKRLLARKGIGGSLPPINTVTMLAFVIKTWNACILGKKLSILKWTDEEEFPPIL